MTEKKQGFLKEYEQLVRKYGICVCACGCCGSPWLLDISQYVGQLSGTTTAERTESHIKHLIEQAE